MSKIVEVVIVAVIVAVAVAVAVVVVVMSTKKGLDCEHINSVKLCLESWNEIYTIQMDLVIRGPENREKTANN